MAVIFSSLTLFLSLFGVGETVRYLSDSISPFQFDESKVNPTLLADAQKADIDAAEYYKARSWKGKLDVKDAAKYNALKDRAASLRDQYRSEVVAAKQKAEAEHTKATSKKEKKDGDNTFYCIIFLIITEVLFWYCFYHKERYEFFAYHEARLAQKIQSPTPPKQATFNGNGAAASNNGTQIPADAKN